MNIVGIALALAGGIVLTAGDIIMKKWIAGGGVIVYGIGLVIYLVGMVFLSQSYKFKNIAVASLAMVIINIITLLIISWLFYHEQLSVLQLIGVTLGLMSVVILELA